MALGRASQQVDLRIVDAVGNPMPVGTKIDITTTDGTISGTGSFTQTNTNVTPVAGAANYSVSIRDDSAIPIDTTTGLPSGTCKDTTLSGVLTVTVTTGGLGTATGTVTFFDGTTNLGTRALSGGAASLLAPARGGAG